MGAMRLSGGGGDSCLLASFALLRRRLIVGELLGARQSRIEAVAGGQLRAATALNYAPGLDHDDFVDVPQCGEPMRCRK